MSGRAALITFADGRKLNLSDGDITRLELALAARRDHWTSRLKSAKGPAREMRAAAEDAEQGYALLLSKWRGATAPVANDNG